MDDDLHATVVLACWQDQMLSDQVDGRRIDIDLGNMLRFRQREIFHVELLGEPLGDLDIRAEPGLDDGFAQTTTGSSCQRERLLQLLTGNELLAYEYLAKF